MTQMTPPRRGRPKGTGIDDRPRLREIAALIARQPNIRPTTAIKLLGENDPSVIRRLRDKFHAMQGELMGDLRQAVAEQAAQRAVEPAPMSATITAFERRPETSTAPMTAPPASTPVAEKPVAPAIHERAEATAARIASLGRHNRPDPSVIERTLDVFAAASADPRPAEAASFTSSNPYDAIVGMTIEASVAAIEQQMRIYEQIFRLPTVSMFVRNHIAVSQALMNIACSAMRASRSLSATTS